MFTWICPKCGGEVPPAYNDCPRCSGQSAAAPAEQVGPPATAPTTGSPVPPAAAAPPVQPTPPSPPLAAAPVAPFPQRQPYTPADPDPYARRRTLSPTVVAMGTAAATLALLATLYLYILPHGRASAAKSEAPAMENAGPGTTARSTHPMAKYLELGGVRIQESKAGRAKIEFIVVNHSAADLPRMTMDVSIRSANRDFFTFPVDVPSLGPYESKDLSQTLKTDLKPYELPDWQLIKPQFSIRSEP